MTGNIHPTAIIEDGAKISNNVAIGPYSIIGPSVTIHDNVILHSHVVVQGHTEIGENTQIFPFASIGSAPQDLKYAGENSRLVIGKNNTIREYVTMNGGTEGGGMVTTIGDNGLFMIGAHIAHDCLIANHVILANNASLAGHVTVGDHVIIGGLAGVHQFVRIGAYAVIGGASGVENDVIPFGRVKGERAHLAGLNFIGLERSGIEKEGIKALQRAFKELFNEEGTMEERLASVEKDFSQNELVMNVVQFARKKTRFPLCQPPKKEA